LHHVGTRTIGFDDGFVFSSRAGGTYCFFVELEVRHNLTEW
jgi:hypothetical protein